MKMEELKKLRALSENEYLDVLEEFEDEHFDEYPLNEEEGIIDGVLVLKKWGRKRNLICFIKTCGGATFKCTDFQDNRNYLGLADIPISSTVALTFRKSRNGNNRLVAAECLR